MNFPFFVAEQDSAGAGIIMLIVQLVVGFIYFLPAYIGRNKRNFNGILVLNLFLGWTVVGWVIALVWAVTKDPGEH